MEGLIKNQSPQPPLQGGKSAAFTKPSRGTNEVRGAGFTLAEVLITLGIIGVVAAMTLPSVIHNYKKKEASSRLN